MVAITMAIVSSNFLHNRGLGRLPGFGEFCIAMADIADAGDLRADVVPEVASQVQDQVAGTVAVRKRIAPELFLGKRIHPFVQLDRAPAIFTGKRRTYHTGKFTHEVASCNRCAKPAPANILRRINDKANGWLCTTKNS